MYYLILQRIEIEFFVNSQKPKQISDGDAVDELN